MHRLIEGRWLFTITLAVTLTLWNLFLDSIQAEVFR